MIDTAAAITDRRLKQIERELKKIYERSKRDVGRAWYKYMTEQDSKIDALKKRYAAAKISGDDKLIKQIGEELGVARAEKTLQSRYYQDMVEATTRRIASVNQTALAYVNDQMPWVYSVNYNDAAKTADKIGINFTLVDENTVRRRVLDGDIKLPRKTLSVPKDMAWNTKHLNSAVLQGIVNGESIDTIAKRIDPIIGNNMTAAVRNARTMVTGAQNQGRLDSYNVMEKSGVVLKKVWIATPDERTRESHLKLDGEEVDPNELFSNKLMYPGDPNGRPEEVYNCRCTMVTNIIGFRKADGTITKVDYTAEPGLHERQMEEERARREQAEAEREEREREKQANTPQVEMSFKDKMEELQRLVDQDGVTTEHVMEAGKLLQDEINGTYEQWEKNIADAKAAYEQAYNEKKAYEKLYDQEWERRVSDLSLYHNQEYLAKMREMEQKLDEMHDRVVALNTAYFEAMNNVRGDKAAELLKSKLAEIRKMGAEGVDFNAHFNKSRSAVRKNIEYAYDKYPSSWVEKSVKRGALKPKSTSRGYYSDYRGEIAISGWNDRMKNETAVHELGHRFERSVPGIKEQEKAFYDRRTAGLPLEWLGSGYRKDEVTRKDDFTHPYMGKDYGGSAYELVSMGFEYAYTDPLKLMKDPDMQQWIFGLLSVVP